MLSPTYIDTMQLKFRELREAHPISWTSGASFNDGGTVHVVIWKAGDKFFRTQHNDWNLKDSATIERGFQEPVTAMHWRKT